MPSTYTDRLSGVSTSTAVKPPCRVATTANIALSGLQTIDGVTLADRDRVLVKNQTDTTSNGIWLAQAGAWTRALDFNGSRDVVGWTLLKVNEGAVNADSYWDVDGNGPVVVGTDAIAFNPTSGNVTLQASLAASSGAAMVGFLQVGTGAVARTLQSKGEDVASLLDFMTTAQKNDYRNQTMGLDLTTAFQASADAVEGVGRNLVVNMLPGILNVTAPIVIDGPVKFRGYGDVGQGMTGDATVNNGTAIKFNHTGIGFDASGFGFECSNCAVYRPQSAPGGGWTPYASDYDFSLAVIDGKVDVLFWGSRKGVNIAAGGRVELTLRGQCFDEGLTIDYATDSIWMPLIHFWPYWSTNANVASYMTSNFEAATFRRCDGGDLRRFFSIWHKRAIGFEHNATYGGTTNLQIGSAYLDEGGAGIETAADTNGVTFQAANIVHLGMDTVTGCALQLSGDNAQADIGSFKSAKAYLNTLRNSDGENNIIRIGRLYMTGWNAGDGGFVGCDVGGTGNETNIGLGAAIGTPAAGSTAAFGGTTQTQGLRKRVAVAGTTGGAGLISFAHGLGYAPQSAEVIIVGANNYVCNVVSIDATNVNCIIYSAASTVNSTAVSGSMNCYY